MLKFSVGSNRKICILLCIPAVSNFTTLALQPEAGEAGLGLVLIFPVAQFRGHNNPVSCRTNSERDVRRGSGDGKWWAEQSAGNKQAWELSQHALRLTDCTPVTLDCAYLIIEVVAASTSWRFCWWERTQVPVGVVSNEIFICQTSKHVLQIFYQTEIKMY